MDYGMGGGGGSAGMFQMQCMLLDTNIGMGGSSDGSHWINLGIVPSFSSSQNLWCRVPAQFSGSRGGAGGPANREYGAGGPAPP